MGQSKEHPFGVNNTQQTGRFRERDTATSWGSDLYAQAADVRLVIDRYQKTAALAGV
jgi:hypothetical protein